MVNGGNQLLFATHHLPLTAFHSSSVNVTFSTSRKLSSTGVERPKMVTTTLSVDLSELTSSTLPVNEAKGPDLMRTVSPEAYVNFGFGFSAASVTLWTIWFTSSGVKGVGVCPPTKPVTFGVDLIRWKTLSGMCPRSSHSIWTST